MEFVVLFYRKLIKSSLRICNDDAILLQCVTVRTPRALTILQDVSVPKARRLGGFRGCERTSPIQTFQPQILRSKKFAQKNLEI